MSDVSAPLDLPRSQRGLALVGARRAGRERLSAEVRAMLLDSKLSKRAHDDLDFHLHLIARYQAGEPGYDRLLLKVHRGLITKAADTWTYRRMSPFDLSDRFQAAKMGVLEACGRVEVGKLNQRAGLTTYIWLYAKHFVSRWVSKEGQVVRLPSHWVEDGVRRPQVKRRYALTFTEMAGARNEEDDQHYEDTLVDDAALSDEQVTLEELQEIIMPRLMWYLISQLDTRHRDVIIDRFAFDQYYVRVNDVREGRSKSPGSKGPQLGEIGRRMGLSRERIRQLEVEGLEMMRVEAARLAPWRLEDFASWCSAVYAGVVEEVQRTTSLPMTFTISYDSVRQRMLLERAKAQMTNREGKGIAKLGDLPALAKIALGAARPQHPAAPAVQSDAKGIGASPQGKPVRLEDIRDKQVADLVAQVKDLEGRLDISRRQRGELEAKLGAIQVTQPAEDSAFNELVADRDALAEELKKAKAYGKTYKEKYAASQMRVGVLEKLAKLKGQQMEAPDAPDLAGAARAMQALVKQRMMTADEALAKLAGVGVGPKKRGG